MLGALLAQSYELEEADAERRRHFYLVTLLCTCLALLAKIAAFPCVAVLALHRVFQPYLDSGVALRTSHSTGTTSLRDELPRLIPHAVVTVARSSGIRPPSRSTA